MILIDILGDIYQNDKIATDLLLAMPKVDSDSTPQNTQDQGVVF